MRASVTVLLIIVMAFTVKAQHLQPYNHGLYFRNITANQVLPPIDSLKILLIEFDAESITSFKETLRNNPQIIELQIKSPPLAAIQFIGGLDYKNLTYLFIKDYNGMDLKIPAMPDVRVFSVESPTLERLSLQDSKLDSLELLAIDAPNLKEWTSDPVFPGLGLIDLTAPQLSVFPIKSMPHLRQFAFACSFEEIPKYLCDCKELSHISFQNYKPISVDECFKQKLYEAFYSDLTTYQSVDGKEVLKILSKDRKE